MTYCNGLEIDTCYISIYLNSIYKIFEVNYFMIYFKVKKVEKTPSSAKESGKKKSKVLNENKKQEDERLDNNTNKKSATLPASSSSPSKVKNTNTDKLNTLGLDSPYQNGSGSGGGKPLVVDVTTTPILAASSTKSSKHHSHVAPVNEPSPISASSNSSGSGSSDRDQTNVAPVTPTNNGGNVARVPVLSASDAVNTNSFVRGVS